VNELILQYSLTETESVRAALERLFILQDKAAGARKVDLFIEEILSRSFPYGAILQGIKDLQQDNLQHIKLGTIIESIQSKIHTEAPVDAPACDFCGGLGMISLRNDKGYTAAFACLCARGDHFQRTMSLARWNGGLIQKNGERIWKVDQVSLRELIASRRKNEQNKAGN
jgi:hypothetical protein